MASGMRSLWVLQEVLERPSRHHMLLQTGRYQVGRDGCLPIGCFSETDVTRLAVMDAPHRMLPETGRYQVVAGMDAPSMLLRTGRDQVGSDGCSPYLDILWLS